MNTNSTHLPALSNSEKRKEPKQQQQKPSNIHFILLVTSWAILFPHIQPRKGQVLWDIQRESYGKYLMDYDSWYNTGSRVQKGTYWMWPTDSNEPLLSSLCTWAFQPAALTEGLESTAAAVPELPGLPAGPVEAEGWQARASKDNCHAKGPCLLLLFQFWGTLLESPHFSLATSSQKYFFQLSMPPLKAPVWKLLSEVSLKNTILYNLG